tara:strand:- start:349 stop:618 length:270 start_codon:yes stop_codon:yes gene_type:complete
MEQLESAEIRLDFDLQDGFKTHDDVDKIKEALAVVLEQDIHDKFTLEQALEVLRIRVGACDLWLYEDGKQVIRDWSEASKEFQSIFKYE